MTAAVVYVVNKTVQLLVLPHERTERWRWSTERTARANGATAIGQTTASMGRPCSCSCCFCSCYCSCCYCSCFCSLFLLVVFVFVLVLVLVLSISLFYFLFSFFFLLSATEMEAKGWRFSPDAHPFIGRRCRRFFKVCCVLPLARCQVFRSRQATGPLIRLY